MIDMVALFKQQIEKRGSDLHLKIGRPPIFRIAGEIVPTEGAPVTSEDMDSALKQVLGDTGVEQLRQEGEMDAAFVVPDTARFRVNVFRRMGEYGLIARAIPLKVPTFDIMRMPPVLKDILTAPQGLILVTGPTGSGKSTTLACMIEHLNQTQPLHVITVEDPVEFVYTDKMCEVTQRQLGSDVTSVHEALRRVLRQDPDVILMGEMRDRETIEMAMHAAETGHLVFSTLHTNDAKQTIDRIIDMFPADAKDHIRSMLAMTLHAIVSQRLVKRAGGSGRTAAMEILINSPNVRDLILANKIREIDAAMKAGEFYRMQTFNQALAKLVQEGLVTEEEAMKTSSNANELKMMLRGIQSGSGASSQAGGSTSSRPAIPPKPAITGDRGDAPPGLKITKGY
jgi:twitching motility protein PilT